MILGGAISQRLGDPDGILEPPTMTKIVGGLRISDRARENYEQNVVPIFDTAVDPVFYAPSSSSGGYTRFTATTSKHTTVMYDNGDWGTVEGDPLGYLYYFGQESGQTITFNITSSVQGELSTDAPFSIDTVTGAQRGQNVIPDPQERPNWAYLTWQCDGSKISFIGMNGFTVCEGDAAIGPVTCLPVNDSGLTLEITMTATAIADGDAYLRWPEKYGIYWTGGANPDSYLSDDGASSEFAYTTAILSGGTYTPKVSQFDDNGNESSKTTGADVTVFELPNPPFNPTIHLTGDVPDYISFSFIDGPEPDAWNCYDSASNNVEFMDVGYPVLTVTGLPLQYPLDIVTPSAFPCTRRVIIRASLNGHEEKNVNIISLEYDSDGNYIPYRPNTPVLYGVPDADETTLNIKASYSPIGQAVSPDAINLYAWIYGDPPNWTTVRATVPVSSIALNAMPRIIPIVYDLAGLVGAGANIEFGIRAASGVYTDGNERIYGPVALTTNTPPAPAFTAEAGS